ncbi:hypothetical protein HSBAA_30040 [Vreelandella sulfidaeris]|uniref:Uncharacterized protein n=1 Tax=Vreelandella sulfidaeris TaxID=115553 RepID=A0A455UBM0_9GAMM|nr:hypothetical protein HSBAA_30040 [Halomonas sulfidaeris]
MGWNQHVLRVGHRSLSAGFTKPVVTELNKRGYNAQLIQKPLPAPLGPELPEIDPFGYTPEYDYQPRAVDTLVREGQGIMQIATGAVNPGCVISRCHAFAARLFFSPLAQC